MVRPIPSPLDDQARDATGAALQATLVDLVDLSLVGKQAHWNLVGRQFHDVHLHLDELVKKARKYSDKVAERGVAVGVPVDGRAATVAADSRVPDFHDGWVTDRDVIRQVFESLDATVQGIRPRIEDLEKADLVTQDLLIEVVATLEEQRWMWQAQTIGYESDKPAGGSTCSDGAGPARDPAPSSCRVVVQSRRAESASGGSADRRQPAALEDDPALGLGEAAPHAERLAGLQRELAAHVHHRAALADLLGLGGAAGPRRVALPVGVEEDRAVHPSARTETLPLPCVVHRAGEAGHIAHVAILYSSVGPSPGDRARLPPPPGGQTRCSTGRASINTVVRHPSGCPVWADEADHGLVRRRRRR